jgi:hypothetical protein
MVLGLAGLGAAWRWAHQVWGLQAIVGEATPKPRSRTPFSAVSSA